MRCEIAFISGLFVCKGVCGKEAEAGGIVSIRREDRYSDREVSRKAGGEL